LDNEQDEKEGMPAFHESTLKLFQQIFHRAALQQLSAKIKITDRVDSSSEDSRKVHVENADGK
jgi:hypothetical protein